MTRHTTRYANAPRPSFHCPLSSTFFHTPLFSQRHDAPPLQTLWCACHLILMCFFPTPILPVWVDIFVSPTSLTASLVFSWRVTLELPLVQLSREGRPKSPLSAHTEHLDQLKSQDKKDPAGHEMGLVHRRKQAPSSLTDPGLHTCPTVP